MRALFTVAERRFAEAVVRLTYCNPFLPERIALEQEVLGDAFDPSRGDWNLHGEVEMDYPNVVALLEQAAALAERSAANLSRRSPTADELMLLEDLALFVLYYRFRDVFDDVIVAGPGRRGTPSLAKPYAAFETIVRRWLPVSHFALAGASEPAHVFACFFQIKRAFHYIYRYIIGASAPVARFRAAAWQSIFTHDLRRYRAVLFDKMSDITTLITGPSGAGKELAARAIAMAQYIPFDASRGRFPVGFHEAFRAVNLSALSPTLVESELFGHVAGAFTGAVKDRTGWLEECKPHECVMLDEIGELDPGIQVKLLRVLQSRVFQRIGDGVDRRFPGKVITATNRNLADQMRAGLFREDLYYRLCADVITAPSLAERLADRPDALEDLVLFIARRLVGEEAESLAGEAMAHIDKVLGPSYPWPGNVRELEQCVRNILIRGSYTPQRAASTTAVEALTEAVAAGTLTVDQLLRSYCTLVYRQSGTYEEAARRLEIDRRTVKSRVDPEMFGCV